MPSRWAPATSGPRLRAPGLITTSAGAAFDGAVTSSGAASASRAVVVVSSLRIRSSPRGREHQVTRHLPVCGQQHHTSSLPRMILRMSKLFVRTLREDPADAEVPSHRLLVRAGYIRRAAPGIYSWLPLGLRVLRKIEQIVREEMDAIGAQELQFPALLPREPYEATRPLDRVRRRHLPAQGPQGRRLPARPDPRGDVHPRREGPVLVVQGPAAVRSTRSRRSTATRRVPAPACCAAASS